MNLNEYQKLSRRTLPKESTFNNLANYGLGLVGEAGEVADELKKVIYHGHDLDTDKISSELGDQLHYIAGIASFLELDLSDIAEGNIKKLEERYPDGFSEDASRNRVV